VGYETAGRTRLLRRLGTAAGSAAAGLLVLTGCAAGQDTQTTAQTPSIDGIQAEAGNIAVRAAGIASPSSGASYPKGGTAALRMVLINRGDQADKLVSVSSPAAGGTQLGAGSSSSGSSGSTGGSPSASDSSSSGSDSASPSATSASSSVPASGSSSAAASSPPSASGSPSSASSAEASSSPSASAASTPIDLPARQSVQVGISDGDATVTLTGLTAELFPAQSVPVTLTFASGASVTVTVAVQLSSASEAPTAPTVTAATQQGGE
jgi:copper(I)-binding protein